ncbi:MAG TPA: glycosyltransferase family 2 protein [Solirubrobacterales bacterium]|nr:glycosyltransferase family 2 protein [Solirubrobacterales bacterium]
MVISAYTVDRWALTRAAVESSRAQTVPVDKVVLCVDDNPELFRMAEDEWTEGSGVPVQVMTNRGEDTVEGPSGSASARNVAIAAVDSEVVVFLDDDARPEPDWVERLLVLYADPDVVAVGGAPLPVYESPRPLWYPTNFDWVFGCIYDGLPRSISQLDRLIGANMSVRREALSRVGGFGVDYPIDDLELCLKLGAEYGRNGLYYTPDAVVHHFVSAERLTWRYFRRRCFSVNREKVHLFERLGAAADMGAERRFALHSLKHRIGGDLREASGGDFTAFARMAAMFAGLSFAAAGRVRGLLDARLERRSG